MRAKPLPFILLALCMCAVTVYGMFIPELHMYTLMYNAGTVVYRQEEHVQIVDDPNDARHSLMIVKCTVLQSFKGRLTPGAVITVCYDPSFHRRLLDDKEVPRAYLPRARALLFLGKKQNKGYEVQAAKLVRDGIVYGFERNLTAGLSPRRTPENFTQSEYAPCGEPVKQACAMGAFWNYSAFGCVDAVD